MTGLDALIAKARSAPPPHRDVDITLDDDTSDRIAALEGELAGLEQDKRLGDTRPKELQDQIDAIRAEAAESVIVLRFHRLPPGEWADITARAPMRMDAVADRLYGYNVHDASRAAAPLSGARLVKGDDGTDVEEPVTEEQWEDLLELMSGRDFSRIADAIFDLNDYAPQQRLDAARKASRAGIGVSST